jgi:hypothetical protein
MLGLTELQTVVDKMFQGDYKKIPIMKAILGDYIQLRTIPVNPQ